VSRSAVYRRWPYKDLFFADLVKELAKNAVPAAAGDESAVIRRVLAEHGDELGTPEQRATLAAEMIRQLALADFEALCGSARWRTYMALNATFTSIADDDTRQQVATELAKSERAHIAAIAGAWELLAGLLGYRLRPDSGSTFETLATLLTAAMRGLVTMALSDPAVATASTRARPFGTTETADWPLPSLALATIASGLLEPDPTITWDAERITRTRQTLDHLAAADTRSHAAAGPALATGDRNRLVNVRVAVEVVEHGFRQVAACGEEAARRLGFLQVRAPDITVYQPARAHDGPVDIRDRPQVLLHGAHVRIERPPEDIAQQRMRDSVEEEAVAQPRRVGEAGTHHDEPPAARLPHR